MWTEKSNNMAIIKNQDGTFSDVITKQDVTDKLQEYRSQIQNLNLKISVQQNFKKNAIDSLNDLQAQKVSLKALITSITGQDSSLIDPNDSKL